MAAALLCMGMLGMQAQTLQFNSNKKFKIVQFTDVHWVPGGYPEIRPRKKLPNV